MNHKLGAVHTFEELLTEYVRERSDDSYNPIRLGFGSIDADLRGISLGQVCGIAARTAVGKTWALASILENFTFRRESGCLVLSLEQPGIEWAERQLAIHLDLAPERIEELAKSRELGQHVGDFLEAMQHIRLKDDGFELEQLPDVLAATRETLAVPLRLVLIDYLGLFGARGKDAYERASALGKGLKMIAKSEQVAVITAMQLSRAAGDGSEPVTLDQLRDSGVLEESLDFLLGCWRPGRKKSLPDVERLALRDVLRVAILKNRKGEDGRVVDLRFRPESRRVFELAEIQ
ncbi:MAG: DnaB helicase C-terminal domain-containing protein [Actinomycetota bacterium]|nr:DnaB helicase C-terminal domain-containing protein [Actinomycetota bacterium]